jgi:hypothetical protein
MAVKHVVTLGYGFSGGVGFIPTLGFSIGEASVIDDIGIAWFLPANRLHYFIPAMSDTATNLPTIAPGKIDTATIVFMEDLDDGELLIGTPTVALTKVRGGGEVGHLTIANEARLAEDKMIRGPEVLADQAVVASVSASSGAVIGTIYKLTATCSTDSTPSRTLKGYALLRVAE